MLREKTKSELSLAAELSQCQRDKLKLENELNGCKHYASEFIGALIRQRDVAHGLSQELDSQINQLISDYERKISEFKEHHINELTTFDQHYRSVQTDLNTEFQNGLSEIKRFHDSRIGKVIEVSKIRENQLFNIFNDQAAQVVSNEAAANRWGGFVGTAIAFVISGGIYLVTDSVDDFYTSLVACWVISMDIIFSTRKFCNLTNDLETRLSQLEKFPELIQIEAYESQVRSDRRVKYNDCLSRLGTLERSQYPSNPLERQTVQPTTRSHARPFWRDNPTSASSLEHALTMLNESNAANSASYKRKVAGILQTSEELTHTLLQDQKSSIEVGCRDYNELMINKLLDSEIYTVGLYLQRENDVRDLISSFETTFKRLIDINEILEKEKTKRVRVGLAAGLIGVSIYYAIAVTLIFGTRLSSLTQLRLIAPLGSGVMRFTNQFCTAIYDKYKQIQQFHEVVSPVIVSGSLPSIDAVIPEQTQEEQASSRVVVIGESSQGAFPPDSVEPSRSQSPEQSPPSRLFIFVPSSGRRAGVYANNIDNSLPNMPIIK